MLDFCKEHGLTSDIEMIRMEQIDEGLRPHGEGRRQVSLRHRHGDAEGCSPEPRRPPVRFVPDGRCRLALYPGAIRADRQLFVHARRLVEPEGRELGAVDALDADRKAARALPGDAGASIIQRVDRDDGDEQRPAACGERDDIRPRLRDDQTDPPLLAGAEREGRGSQGGRRAGRTRARSRRPAPVSHQSAPRRCGSTGRVRCRRCGRPARPPPSR